MSWNLPEKHTIGEFIRAVLAIETEEEARAFFDGCVAFIQRQVDAGIWKSPGTAVEGARSNIGWCFGEGMEPKKVAMWHRATGSSHPVFGIHAPSEEAALAAGKDWAKSK